VESEKSKIENKFIAQKRERSDSRRIYYAGHPSLEERGRACPPERSAGEG